MELGAWGVIPFAAVTPSFSCHSKREYRLKTSNVDRPIFIASVVILLAVAVPLILNPEAGEKAVAAVFDFITTRFGFLYIWAAVATLVFVLWLGFGRYGRVRLARDDRPPDFSTFSWAAMLFCAGIGTGILYWGTIEWAFYYMKPPFGVAPGSAEAIDWATSYPIFHWGITGWAFYCLPALVIGYTYYARGNPTMHLSVSCRAVIGKHADGVAGKVIDILFMVGLIGAAGTGVGLAVPLISAGASRLFDIPDSFTLQLGVVLLVTIMFCVSVYLGLEKGIKQLSNINVILTFVLLVFVLTVGPTLFIIKTGTASIGHVLQNFVKMSSWTDSVAESGFVESWTVFYWAWWIALGPYVGMFVAKISRGRTIRQVVLGVIGYGTLGCALFFIVFGNYALHLELNNLLSVTGILSEGDAPTAIVSVISTLPFGAFALFLFSVICLIFMATTYDSAAYTLAMGASQQVEVDASPARWHRLFWAFGISILPITLMFLGGLEPFKTASIVVSLPMIGIGLLMAVSFVRSLKMDHG